MSIFRKIKKKPANSDFEAFKSDITWFLNSNSKVEFQDQHELRLNEDFRSTFPELTNLIQKSRQTFLTIDSIDHIIFAWDTKDQQVCGWLNQQETCAEFKCELIVEHELLLRNIGGIRESFNQPEDSFTNNQNFLFIGSKCSKGIGDWNDYYSTTCEEDEKDQIDYTNFISFVYEANGALTLYEPKTKEVFLFSHDHSFENVEFMENQPEYTFHRFKNARNFTQYVEEMASQWNEIVA